MELSEGEKSLIDNIVKKVVSIINLQRVQGPLDRTIKDEYMKGVDEIEIAMDINIGYDPERVNYLQDYTFDNIKSMTEGLADNLRKELQQAFINQEPLAKIKERVKKVLEVGEYRAAMIARTETNRAQNIGRLDAAKTAKAPFKKYLIIAEDERTSDICGALHKKYGSREQAIPLDSNFKVSVKQGKKFLTIDQQSPPFHPNCRTQIAMAFSKES